MLRSGSATDVGRVRPINQDMPLERPNLYAVADGMGGHVGGEVAARVAVETLEQAFEREPTVTGLRDAFSEANAAVWQESQINADLRGMGTTLTAVALVGGEEGQDVLALANVGDSRAYVYSDGRLFQVTADHSLAEERMRHGEMTEAEAAVHPQRHILTRALGVSSEVQTDMWELQLRTGDRVMLCSDGLSNEVGMDEMAGILGEIRDPGDAAGRLVDAANEHGGADNITVIIVDVQVGEDGPDGASKITPIGASAAAITIASAGAATAAVAAVPNGAAPAPKEPGPGGNDAPEPSDATQALPLSGIAPLPAFSDSDSDTLAPGARLGFGSETRTLGEEGPRSDEFFVGSGTVSVARTSTRVPLAEQTPAPRDTSPKRKEKETRRERRRRLGIPRRVTFRVLGFVLLVAAVPIAAYFVLRWYAYDNWIVTLHGNQVVIEQGQPGGVLWFHPKVVDRTGVKKDQLSTAAANALVFGIQKSSLHDARRWVSTVTTTTTTTTTTTVPNGSTTTTKPSATAGSVP
ncbi:MAG TPA: Stp1/IreP family PP2C-type Ser/Thr phosphatase [Acidimicrobiales bacterium]|nr:Stp1/IreP family PP2C-type Ser/Thr phosphatase [Acidimicrobiales bacterium]